MNKVLHNGYNDWNIIYKIMFPLAYIKYLAIVLNDIEKKKQENEE